MSNNTKGQRKQLLYSIGAVIAITVIFFGGYLYGSAVTYDQFSVPGVKNKEAQNISPTAVDFAPFWRVWNLLDQKYVSTATSTTNATDQERVWGAIAGLAESLGDPYTVFFPPEDSKQFEEDISGNFSGIGAELSVRDDQLVVVSPLKGSPAEKAGLQSEDVIIAIDGKTASGITIDEAIDKIRGPIGTNVELTVTREGASGSVDIQITRDNIEIPVINTEHREKDGVFVISLYNFTANSASQFQVALQDFAKTGEEDLIIDLRNNPGGYLEHALFMASWFLPEGEPVVIEDYGEKRENVVHRSKGYNRFPKELYNVVVLINGGSASASEILAGALREHNVADLVGTKSFGKGSVQELVSVTPDTSLKVTIARWLTPNGNSISKNGLTPDYIVEFTDGDIENEIDVQMEKAVEILRQK